MVKQKISKNKKTIFLCMILILFYFCSPTNYNSVISNPIYSLDDTNSEEIIHTKNPMIIYYFNGEFSYDQKIGSEYRTIIRNINNTKMRFHFIETGEESKIVTTYKGLFIRFYSFNEKNMHLFDKNIYSIDIYCQKDQLKFINLQN